MPRVSRILLTVSVILSFVAAGILFLTALILIGCGVGFFGLIAEQSQEGAAGYLAGMLAGGLICLYFAVMALVNGIVSNVAKKNPVKKNLICAIVFSALSCTWVGVAGGVTGIIALDKQARRDRRDHIADAE